jgi:hypothetical protein
MQTMRGVVGWFGRKCRHWLDWFHVSRRLRIRKDLLYLPAADDFRSRLAFHSGNLDSVKWTLGAYFPGDRGWRSTQSTGFSSIHVLKTLQLGDQSNRGTIWTSILAPVSFLNKRSPGPGCLFDNPAKLGTFHDKCICWKPEFPDDAR